MAAKKKKEPTEVVPEEEPQAPIEEPVEQSSEQPVQNSAVEWWQCSHCPTRYRADMVIARENHLARVHGIKGS